MAIHRAVPADRRVRPLPKEAAAALLRLPRTDGYGVQPQVKNGPAVRQNPQQATAAAPAAPVPQLPATPPRPPQNTVACPRTAGEGHR